MLVAPRSYIQVATNGRHYYYYLMNHLSDILELDQINQNYVRLPYQRVAHTARRIATIVLRKLTLDAKHRRGERQFGSELRTFQPTPARRSVRPPPATGWSICLWSRSYIFRFAGIALTLMSIMDKMDKMEIIKTHAIFQFVFFGFPNLLLDGSDFALKACNFLLKIFPLKHFSEQLYIGQMLQDKKIDYTRALTCTVQNGVLSHKVTKDFGSDYRLVRFRLRSSNRFQPRLQ